MLVLSRKSGEKIHIGNNITISVIQTQSNKVKIGIDAPDEVRILRGELAEWFFDRVPDEDESSTGCSDGCVEFDYAL